MSVRKFKNGDEVVCIKEDSWVKVGMKGVICVAYRNISYYEHDVKWDSDTLIGHNGDSRDESTNHRYMNSSQIALAGQSLMTFNYLIL